MIESIWESFNYGFTLIKILMCFGVVLHHCWATEDVPGYLQVFSILKPYAVPTFMFISFYLTQKSSDYTSTI